MSSEQTYRRWGANNYVRWGLWGGGGALAEDCTSPPSGPWPKIVGVMRGLRGSKAGVGQMVSSPWLCPVIGKSIKGPNP